MKILCLPCFRGKQKQLIGQAVRIGHGEARPLAASRCPCVFSYLTREPEPAEIVDIAATCSGLWGYKS